MKTVTEKEASQESQRVQAPVEIRQNTGVLTELAHELIARFGIHDADRVAQCLHVSRESARWLVRQVSKLRK